MNEFDQFVKHELKIEHYARYTDDIIIISTNLEYLQGLIKPIEKFLHERLKLNLHPKKTVLRKYINGVDFLGYNILPHCILVRKRSKNRMFRKCRDKISDYNAGKITKESLDQTIRSYIGMLSHADAHKLTRLLKNQSWFLRNSKE
jgi:hypothetical protein